MYYFLWLKTPTGIPTPEICSKERFVLSSEGYESRALFKQELSTEECSLTLTQLSEKYPCP